MAHSDSAAIVQITDEEIDHICEEFGNREGAVVQILQTIQEKYGYVPAEILERVGDDLGIPHSKMFGVLTFYSQFYREPRGKFILKVCVGTACHVRGAGLLVDKIKENLNVEEGENTEDMLFTLEPVSCLGSCALAPMAMVNGNTYGKLSGDKMVEILRQIKDESSAEPVSEATPAS
ncbi:MAG: NADH-quinone oxidoreductase subunit NuoE [Leptospirales bacterium]